MDPTFKKSRPVKKVRKLEPLDKQMLKDTQVVPKTRKTVSELFFSSEDEAGDEGFRIQEKPLLNGKSTRKLYAQILSEEGHSFEKEPLPELSEEEEEAWQDDMDVPEFDEEDQELFEKWVSPISASGLNLADLILEKLNSITNSEKEHLSSPSERIPSLPEKLVLVYEKLGILLSRYKSGKLPKAFKILPALSNWSEVLSIAHPDKWTPNAVYQATRLFSSTLKPVLAQRFYTCVLLPHVRTCIREHKKLNSHLYQALKKAIYKPSAFFKGIILPICQNGDCSLREAVIISSILSKISIPVLHSAACLLKLSEMEHTGSLSIFIRTLLDKKYSLPERVLAGLVDHFYAVKNDSRPCYVLWHQSLLVFVQRYKDSLDQQQKSRLLSLCASKSHPLITPEIVREIKGF